MPDFQLGRSRLLGIPV